MRDTESIEHFGIVEKRFRASHQFVTILDDLDCSQVLEMVVESRIKETTKQMLISLAEKQRTHVQPIAIDMWQAFTTAVRNVLTRANIAHERSISAYT
ncbi:transposase [Prosthecochloris sp. SCSIO W1101]|uniref:transposase n=1 Tax=Prosthecochloris sp. SCSIO W1101 TaxID=2992242 RepID=UPI00223D2FD8|nr:transposase [Prosthecochloris sp. SCSIO W1101]UZJ41951.1 transposase [Prosthecochloris sp. SCSIO W1101]